MGNVEKSSFVSSISHSLVRQVQHWTLCLFFPLGIACLTCKTWHTIGPTQVKDTVENSHNALVQKTRHGSSLVVNKVWANGSEAVDDSARLVPYQLEITPWGRRESFLELACWRRKKKAVLLSDESFFSGASGWPDGCQMSVRSWWQ